MTFHCPEQYRVRNGPLATTFVDGNNGAFALPGIIANRQLAIIASDGRDWKECGLEGVPWEHVSVHVFQGKQLRTPTWNEMCSVKEMFWDEEDVVIQFHPAKSEYVNNHPCTLHLWRPIGIQWPTPPASTVGDKSLGTIGGRNYDCP